MASKFLTIFLLLALVALVNAQNETNTIDQCIKRENCALDDRECRAACAGVPDPDPQAAVDTQTCYKKCADDHLPSDEPAYKECIKNCREDIYQEGVTEPGSTAPSKAQKDGSDSGDSGKSGEDSKGNSSESGDASSSDGNDTNTNKTDESGASFSAKSAHVYVLATVLACVAFTVGL